MKKGLLKTIIILSLLLVTLTPLSVKAATSGTCGDNLTWSLDSTGTLVITGEGNMTNFDSVYDVPWRSSVAEIKTLQVDEGITSIGNYAFYDCKNLSQITLPNSIQTIGQSAFYNTEYYNNSENWENNVLYIQNYLIGSKTALSGKYSIKNGTKVVGDVAFKDRGNLTEIEIPNSVITIGSYAFSGTPLTEVTVPDSVTKIENYAFYACSKLSKIKLSSNLTKINGATFRYCENLSQIVIPVGVTQIDGSAFDNCSKLTEITIPEGVTTIGTAAFYCCSGLKSITLPSTISKIGNMAFYNCNSLADVYYYGNSSRWNSLISIDSNNSPLTFAKRHYFYTVTQKNTNTFTTTPLAVNNDEIIIFACYKNNKIVYIETFEFGGESSKTFTPNTEYDTVKVMVWSNLKNCVPLCNSEEIYLN